MVELSDAGLIEVSLADPNRFGALFDRHMGEIRRYLHRRVGTADGDELTAETFAVAFRTRAGYDLSRDDARPWLYGIAANLIRNRKRSERRQARAYARSAPEIEAGIDLQDVHERIDARALRPRVFAALSALRPEDRELVLLQAWGELTHSEIAAALDMPIGTVKSRLSRALDKLRNELGLPPSPMDGPASGVEPDEEKGVG